MINQSLLRKLKFIREDALDVLGVLGGLLVELEALSQLGALLGHRTLVDQTGLRAAHRALGVGTGVAFDQEQPGGRERSGGGELLGLVTVGQALGTLVVVMGGTGLLGVRGCHIGGNGTLAGSCLCGEDDSPC